MQLALDMPGEYRFTPAVWKMAAALFALLIAAMAVQAQEGTLLSPDDKAPLVVEGVSEGDVFGMGRSVEVRGLIKKGVIAFGGDVLVEGRVEGDVAAIGGSVVQREGSYIGGDVLVFGGAYHHGKTAPARQPEKIGRASCRARV